MKFSLLTYNILYNRALTQVPLLIERYHPDIICIQELDTSEKNLLFLEKYGYSLADYANSFLKFGTIYGIATFYRTVSVVLSKSTALFFPQSVYEFLLSVLRFLRGGNKPRTILATDFFLKRIKKRISVFNVHLTVIGANGIRIKQIKEALNFRSLEAKRPGIIAGDFNYFPYGRKRLETLMDKYRFREATNHVRYTIQFSHDGKLEKYNFLQKFFAKLYSRLFTDKLKNDYVFYKLVHHIKTERIDMRFSDHYPVISWFEM